MTDEKHTLFIVERDDLDDAVPYQVTKAEHPPDSEQAKALEGVMCQLVEVAEDETGAPHRLVREVDTPAVTQSHYELHEERIEEERLVTDGGQREAEIDLSEREPPKEGDVTLTEDEIDLLVEVLPGVVAEEKRIEARQMMYKTGRGERLERVIKKLEEVKLERREAEVDDA
ncbi:hypothetical protein [Halorubrum tropicale]|uniref:Uncharacterized protein n=1 Tax=Halorubrum tropicale TaxID=1765655 RepID=A0A0M9ALR9_9EURY|nr:hypothetical protein [Halorubrum tropicale]KOX93251.1 hypothetical protein AMR74_16545 [Halorubrum tropicale]